MSFSTVPLLKLHSQALWFSLTAPGLCQRLHAVPLGNCFSPFGGCTSSARTSSLLSVGAVTPKRSWLW